MDFEKFEKKYKGLDSRWRRETIRGTEVGISIVLTDKISYFNGGQMLQHTISEIPAYAQVVAFWWAW